jgi:hypothetical protein
VAWQLLEAEVHTLIDSRSAPDQNLNQDALWPGFVKWWYNKAIVIVKSCIQLSAIAYVVECRR